MTACLLAIDLGTTRIKFGALDASGSFRLIHSAEATVFPEPGAAIQEPDGVTRACIDGLQRCAAAFGRAEGLVLTGQMGGVVVVDRDGAAVTPWITAMDARCRESTLTLRRAAGSRIRQLSASAPFQAERIHWLRRSTDLPDGCLALLLPAYVASQLAAEGRRAAFCERTCAGWSGLADVVALRWDDELAAAADWSSRRLPPIVATGAEVGTLSRAAATATGLPAGLPIHAGPGDQAAAFYALGCTRPGDVVDSASTFPVLAGVVASFAVPANPRIELMPSAIEGVWHPLGYLLGSGALPAWFAAAIADTSVAVLEREAEAVGPSDGILVLPSGVPGAGGGRRLVFQGVDVAHRRAHLYRAILEGLACEYALMAEDLGSAGVQMRAPVIAIGGGTASRLLTRLKANLTGLPWQRVDGEFTLVGASLFVARALGWDVRIELPRCETTEPDTAAHDANLLERYRRARQSLLASSETER
jgi:xylulokinase